MGVTRTDHIQWTMVQDACYIALSSLAQNAYHAWKNFGGVKLLANRPT